MAYGILALISSLGRDISREVKLPTRIQLKKALGYVLINFATPIAFYLTFRIYGPKPAIAFGIGVTCIQLVFHRLYRIRPSPFFLLASGFTVAFGTIDLF